MKLLLLGSGGREHALAWKIAQSPKIEKLYIAPGNAGTPEAGENVAIKADDFDAIKQLVLEKGIDMVVVGPEDPLVKGIYDYFKNNEALKAVPVIGPSKAGAVLEGSKEFAKGFMQRHHIPTAGYKSITAANLEEGLAFLETLEAPYVLKADGLCAGKGVLILPTLEEAKKELKEMLGGMFGNASSTVVIEEFLSGIECSVFVLTDGKNYKILPEEILVVHDELDLMPGCMKLKKGGGNAGHNGLKDITEKLATPNFWRLRLGTGHPRTLGLAQPVADFVLHAPSDEHKSLILECISAALKTSNDIACGDMARVQRAIAKYGIPKPKKEDAEEK